MGCSFDELEPDSFDDLGPNLLWETLNSSKGKFKAYNSITYYANS